MMYLTDRYEIAKAMNFRQFPVVRINLETPMRGWDDAYEGDKVLVVPSTDRPGSPWIRATIRKFSDEANRYTVMPETVGIADSFGYRDVMECLDFAHASVLSEGDLVTVIEDWPNRKVCQVHMMKVSNVREHVFPTCYLEEVEPEEVQL